MNNKLSSTERRHIAVIKQMPCGLCGASPPSDAHHISQGQQFITIPLCKDCHQGPRNGIHGEQVMWKVMKQDELSVLNQTVRKLREE